MCFIGKYMSGVSNGMILQPFHLNVSVLCIFSEYGVPLGYMSDIYVDSDHYLICEFNVVIMAHWDVRIP